MYIKKPNILLAPLDWGMGHTSRCICLIEALQANNANVFVACNKAQRAFLEQEIQEVEFLELPGYDIQFSNIASLNLFKIILQIPKVLRAINQENKWLHKILEKTSFDGIISDNRYGLHHTDIPSVFLSHQLNIRSSIATKAVSRLQSKYINKFRECWVPDVADNAHNLSGDLSHGTNLFVNPLYIGPLSRLEKCEPTLREQNLLVILSGPEPQKTILLEKILANLNSSSNIKILIAGEHTIKQIPTYATSLGVVNRKKLEQIISNATHIISRSGYTTIMDLAKLGKTALLIPTPGQSEQIYLAKLMASKNLHMQQLQSNLDIAKYVQFSGLHTIELNFTLHQQIIKNWLQTIGK